jgi:hypothetical protein
MKKRHENISEGIYDESCYTFLLVFFLSLFFIIVFWPLPSTQANNYKWSLKYWGHRFTWNFLLVFLGKLDACIYTVLPDFLPS